MSGTGGLSKKEKKGEYFNRLVDLLRQYHKILIVLCDNIGSNHMQNIRKSLRGQAVLLMGKNTMIRRAIRSFMQESAENSSSEAILPYISGNIGLVFTNDQDLKRIRDICLESKVPAAAKPGIKAPSDVIVPKGLTQLEPTKTSFLQALNIASKINKGTIEILQDVPLIKKGDKVGSSESTLLQMLDIRPFEYSLQMVAVYDTGSVFDAEVLNMTDSDILSRFAVGIGNVASVSLGINFPTIASFPHVVLNSYKNLLAVALQTDYVFEQATTIKQMAENPEAFVSAVQTTTTTTEDTKEVEAEPVEEVKEEEEVIYDLFS